jgi:hypothetical protein
MIKLSRKIYVSSAVVTFHWLGVGPSKRPQWLIGHDKVVINENDKTKTALQKRLVRVATLAEHWRTLALLKAVNVQIYSTFTARSTLGGIREFVLREADREYGQESMYM